MGQLTLGVEPVPNIKYAWDMLALSLKEPWLQLIIDGRKRFEFRPWRPRHDLPISVLLCSSKTFGKEERDTCLEYGYSPLTMKRSLGRARATAIVRRCYTVDERFCRANGFEYYKDDRGRTVYAWELKEIVHIKAEPHVIGALGLFHVRVTVPPDPEDHSLCVLDSSRINTATKIKEG